MKKRLDASPLTFHFFEKPLERCIPDLIPSQLFSFELQDLLVSETYLTLSYSLFLLLVLS